ncbi:hypothetical protein NEPTK9_001570 [Candidatus Neptunochlamydia vexilliferae]|uniref:Uncharacterized protein n=1 Tax=Candidatus Neptunichlamydia vexilliferae TaxID=1651774 RepID=A0ABS0B0X8_9BACT|nr:hypothetical protein [Candidatus Neptunochlamydia vexilliferae]
MNVFEEKQLLIDEEIRYCQALNSLLDPQRSEAQIKKLKNKAKSRGITHSLKNYIRPSWDR